MLMHLPGGNKTSGRLNEVLNAAIQRLSNELERSSTWNQCKEMAEHREFTIAIGVQVSFCDPRSPLHSDSMENTNGLLRQYLPKNADIGLITQQQCHTIAAELNLGHARP